VYAPVLFGSADAANAEKPTLGRILSLWISREFTLLAANKASPVTEWLRALARLAHEECGGHGIGAIGMCLTGGFALSMALEPVVLARVRACTWARSASEISSAAGQVAGNPGWASTGQGDHLIHRASCGLIGRAI
jgi:dienelactone hydrolase